MKRTNEEMARMVKIMSDALAVVLEDVGDKLGVPLSEITLFGSMVSVGNVNSVDPKRCWYLTLATNDAGRALREWAKNETAERIDAAQSLAEKGYGVYQKDDKEWPKP